MFLTKHFILFSYFLYIVLSRHMDFRERFLERKRLRALKDQRLKALNRYVLKNTVILDDITHYRYRKVNGKSLKACMTARVIEKDFRRLLAMDGMKYNYKRDLYWRTWRSISPVNNATNQIVCYKCNNPSYVNTTPCQNCGMWTIEEQPPPCPFEFFSLLTKEKICGANYTQYKDVNNTCPSVINFTDLTATCDNPIQTQWRFSKMYGVLKKYEEVICKNKDFCDILTLYEITPEHVVFRIINSTNDVIYSRIMKPKLRNYICVHDCGRFNPNTRKVTKADRPLKIDFLGPREIIRPHIFRRTKGNFTKRVVPNEMIENVTKRPLSNEMNESVSRRGVFLNDINVSVTKRSHNLHKSQDTKMQTEESEIKEVLSDILPAEEISESNDRVDGDKGLILESIEENGLHMVKSRRLKKLQSNMVSEEAVALKPTNTSGQTVQKAGNLYEEYENDELVSMLTQN